MTTGEIQQPRLRAVELIHLPGENGEPMACLRDRLDPDARPLMMSQGALMLASLMDGQRTLGEIRSGFMLRSGLAVTEEQLSRFVGQLDRAYLLDTPRSRERMARLADEFRALKVRPAAHAGGAYPAEQRALRSFLNSLYTHPDGPGVAPQQTPEAVALSGLIAPHIDLHRGGPLYGWAYRALAEAAPAELYVLLGTCHAGMRGTASATRKSYDTPFGHVPTDEAFLDDLQSRFADDLYADEYQHRAEHSLEFQALYLRALGLAGGTGAATVVPILCNSLQALVAPGQEAWSSTPVRTFVEALRGAIAASGKRVCIIAGADLAHVGPQFGDPRALGPSDLARVEEGDREMLAHVCAGDAEAFYTQVMRDDDARRICGLSPIYYLLATLGSSRGELLRYAQWVDSTGNGAVTYAAVTLRAA